MGDGDAVIGNRDTRLRAALEAEHHLPAVPGTGAAVDHQAIRPEVFREVSAAAHVDRQRPADILLKPAWYFDPSDIVADGVVRTSLGDQHPVPRLQALNGAKLRGIAMIPARL